MIKFDFSNKIVYGQSPELDLTVFLQARQYFKDIQRVPDIKDKFPDIEWPFDTMVDIVDQENLSITSRETIILKKGWRYMQASVV